ncbi:MAG: hypothetical protein ACTSWY_12400 [Promethearchaeota archaeon]
MTGNDEDFLIKRGEYSENLADQHLKSLEYKKSKKFYKEAFLYFKKSGDKERCFRVKEKYDKVAAKLKEE